MVTRREQLGTADHQREGDADKATEVKDTKKPRGCLKRPASKVETGGSAKAAKKDKGKDKEKDAEKKKTRAPKKAKDTDQSADNLEVANTSNKKKPKDNKDDKDSKEEGTVKKRKGAKAVDKANETKNPEPKEPKDAIPPPQAKVAKTWAGRWIPTDPVQLAKFTAIRQVFENCLSKKLTSPSTLASSFFALCNKAFKAKGLDNAESTVQQMVEAAELEVENFLKMNSVRTWVVCSRLQIFFSVMNFEVSPFHLTLFTSWFSFSPCSVRQQAHHCLGVNLGAAIGLGCVGTDMLALHVHGVVLHGSPRRPNSGKCLIRKFGMGASAIQV